MFLIVQSSWATESGGSIYPNGNENYLVGAVPPPGFYALVYGDYFHSNTLRDNHGDRVPVDFMANVVAVAPRFVWVTKQKILGGDLALHTILPLLNVDVQVGNKRDTSTGLGDIVIGPGLGYHLSDKFHYALGFDINMPTGTYDKNRLANTSRNYWNIEPIVAATYVQPEGINADIKVMYDFNFENQDTKYTSGQELHADYAIGWGFGNGWVVGLGGYAYQQVTDDERNGVTVPNNNGRAFAVGPSIKYDNGKGWFITAKWQEDLGVKNRADGHELKVKMIIPF
jgi:hypothetical protein